MIHRHEFRAMGCRMLTAIDIDNSEPPDVLDLVPVWFEEWEQSLSRFRSDSELCQLNAQAGKPVKVSDVLWDVFQVSLEAERMTSGLVTPLILDALIYAGYDRSFETLFGTALRFLPDGPSTINSLDQVGLDNSSRSIVLPAEARLDFGGVAKGWAAAKTAERLREAGPALVDAGGDMAISGPRLDGSPWQIGVENPFARGEDLETLYLDGGGVATSGKDYHRWMRGNLLQHHIIDPRSGLPAETDILTATIIAPTAVKAEAFAKAVLISGSQAGMALLECDPELAGLLILENGQLVYSQNLQNYL